MSHRDVRVAVYGDVDLNIIDGSAIWLQSIVSVLARQSRVETTVVLKAPEQRDLLTRPLAELEAVTLVNPIDEGRLHGRRMSTEQALATLAALDGQRRFDAFVLRGFRLCHDAATRWRRLLGGRLWCYLTDIPQHPSDFAPDSLAGLESIAEASRFVLCQTEELRCHLEAFVTGAAGKAVLLPPMIPDEAPRRDAAPAGEPLRLVYVGKFAPRWNTYEMTQTVARLRAAGAAVELHMIGDKIHRDPSDESYHDRMLDALHCTDGVHWHGARSRHETQAMIARCDVALGWRAPVLDESLELSTKLLEYGAAGLPVIFNRTPMHERLVGGDYPLFVDDSGDLEPAIAAARDEGTRREAASRCVRTAERFTFARVAEKVGAYVERAVPPRSLGGRGLRVLVASHDFKFFTRIAEHLDAIRGVEVRVDPWQSIGRHSDAHGSDLNDWADVVICEWCGANAAWHSEHKRPGQRLIVRLHRAELYSRFVDDVRFESVDCVVFVGEYYRAAARARLGWDERKLTVIPNWVDTMSFARDKVFGAAFNLGMIGIAPQRKRLDRALNVLARLRAVDDRFQLFLKGKLPWQYAWVWREERERAFFRDVFSRINATPELRGAVHFDPFGRDVAAWLRKIGYVLSTSDDESFHLAPAEGMASGALPLFLPWEGADALYPDRWIHDDETAIVETILEVLDEGSWQRHSDEVRRFVCERYSAETVCAAWEELVTATGA